MCDRAYAQGVQVIYDPQAVVKHAHGVSSRTNPIVMKLFTQSAWEYHGWVKKLTIDAVIRFRDLFTRPLSSKKVLVILALILLILMMVRLFSVLFSAG